MVGTLQSGLTHIMGNYTVMPKGYGLTSGSLRET